MEKKTKIVDAGNSKTDRFELSADIKNAAYEGAKATFLNADAQMQIVNKAILDKYCSGLTPFEMVKVLEGLQRFEKAVIRGHFN